MPLQVGADPRPESLGAVAVARSFCNGRATDAGKVFRPPNDQNEVAARPVRAGALHDGLRAITDGLKPGERVIVNGLQQVRPGAIVEPTRVEMPNGNHKSTGRGPKAVVRN